MTGDPRAIRGARVKMERVGLTARAVGLLLDEHSGMSRRMKPQNLHHQVRFLEPGFGALKPFAIDWLSLGSIDIHMPLQRIHHAGHPEGKRRVGCDPRVGRPRADKILKLFLGPDRVGDRLIDPGFHLGLDQENRPMVPSLGGFRTILANASEKRLRIPDRDFSIQPFNRAHGEEMGPTVETTQIEDPIGPSSFKNRRLASHIFDHARALDALNVVLGNPSIVKGFGSMAE